MFTIAIVGNFNSGRTSLFNYFIYKKIFYNFNNKKCICDFNYGLFDYKKKFFVCIDTSGINNFNFLKKKNNFNNKDLLLDILQKKFIYILDNVDFIFLLIESIDVNYKDFFFLNFFLKYKNKIYLLISKIDLFKNYKKYIYKFLSFKVKEVYFISIYKENLILKLMDKIYLKLTKKKKINFLFKKYILYFCINFNKYFLINFNFINIFLNIKKEIKLIKFIKLIILGKPNIGKSTFLNFISKKDRSLVSSNSYTTKDFLICNLFLNNIIYLISDSPGLCNQHYVYRKKKYIFFWRNIFFNNIIIYMFDINIGITRFDLRILKFLLNNGKFLILIFNKSNFSNKEKQKYKKFLFKRYDFMKYMNIYFFSKDLKKNNKNINIIYRDININYKNIFLYKINSLKLTKILKKAIDNFNNKNITLNTVKLKYAHVGRYNPLLIVIHGNKIDKISISYKKYLLNFYMKSLKIHGCIISLKFKEIYNPFIKKK